SNGRSVAYFYMVCPLYAMAMAMETASRSRNFGFTLNVCATQFLAWCLLAIACLRTRRAWRDLPASERRQKWQTRWERFRLGGERTRERWRGMMLEQNHPAPAFTRLHPIASFVAANF